MHDIFIVGDARIVAWVMLSLKLGANDFSLSIIYQSVQIVIVLTPLRLSTIFRLYPGG